MRATKEYLENMEENTDGGLQVQLDEDEVGPYDTIRYIDILVFLVFTL